jgi:type IV secretion system protein VirB6
MIGACSNLTDAGMIRGVLAAVDCQTRVFAETGYSALTSTSSTFQMAVTALLTIYVAIVGYRMLFASRGARLSDAPGMALKIGAVLALITSWATFETLVFNVASRAPTEIAGIVAGPLQSGGLASRPVEGLQSAYDQITALEAAFGKAAGSASIYASPDATAADALSSASGVLFLSTAGTVAASTLVIGVLTAVGPLFISLFLIPATRGLAVGWLRAVAAAAFVTLVSWLLIVLMLSVIEPWLVTLALQQKAATLNPQTAISLASLVFVFAAGEAALVISALVMALGFRLPRRAAAKGDEAAGDRAQAAAGAPVEITSRAQRLAWDLQRDQAADVSRAQRLVLTGMAAPAAAAGAARRADDGPAGRGGYRRPTLISRRSGAGA